MTLQTTSMTTNLSGQTIAGGRYRVDQRLGTGSMGHVFRAKDHNLETDVVIKVPTLARLEIEEFRNRFLQESRFLVKLTHPHIVRILDVGEHGTIPYFVMQFIGGGSLETRIYPSPTQATPQSLAKVAEWLPRMADALDFVHGRGYIHRDIKPANILFDEFGHAYLSDFGLSRLVHPDEDNSRMTAAGAVVGTPNYVAPEVVLGMKYDGRADQYSLAMTIYEALTGLVPLEGPSPSATMVNQTSKVPPPPSQHNPGLPAAVDAVILRALSKSAGKRYPNCQEFSSAFLAAAGLSSSSGEIPQVTDSVSGLPRKKSPSDTRRPRAAQESMATVGGSGRSEALRSTIAGSGETQIAPSPAKFLVKKTVKVKRDGSAQCPKCTHLLKLRAKHAGQKGQCVKCKGLLVISKDLREVKHVVLNKRAGSGLTEADFALALGNELFGWKLPAIVAMTIAAITMVVVLVSVATIGFQTAQDPEKRKEERLLQHKSAGHETGKR